MSTLAADLDLNRSLRDAYRTILATLNDMKREETDLRGLIAICSIFDDTQQKFDHVSRRLVRLERLAGGAR